MELKKPKFTFEELQVESFVTSLTDEQKETIDGGTSVPCGIGSAIIVSAAIYSLIAHITDGTCDPMRSPCPIPATYVAVCTR